MARERERLDGITACAPTSAIDARKRSESKPISASRFSKENPLIRPSAWQMSLTWPAVRMKRTGLPRASTPMLILVLRPPRERPIASSSLPLLGAGRMLVRPHDGGIDDQVFEVRIFTELGEKTLPNALFCPSPETPEHAVPFAKLFGQVTPRRSGTDQPQHTVDEQPIVLAVPPLVAFLAWNKRFNAPPLRVRQLPPNQNRPPQLRS